MEVNVSVLMAIVDFIPVVVFMAGMGFLLKLTHHRISAVMFAMQSGGAFLGFLAGICKCTWKLLYAFGIDFVPLNSAFILYQTAGFFFIMLALISFARSVVRHKTLRRSVVLKSICALPVAAAVLVIEKPSFLFFVFMGIFTSAYLIAMAVVCFFKKKPLWAVMYLLSMILMFSMVALSKQFDAGGSFEKLNWLAQCINVLVQLLMALPSWLLLRKYGTVKTECDHEML